MVFLVYNIRVKAVDMNLTKEERKVVADWLRVFKLYKRINKRGAK